jgi:hypothetical protein
MPNQMSVSYSKHSHTLSPDSSSSVVASPAHKHVRTGALDQIKSLLEARDEEERKELEQARQEEQDRHNELREGLREISDAMTYLAKAIIEDRQQQAQDEIACQAEMSTLLTIIRSLAGQPTTD